MAAEPQSVIPHRRLRGDAERNRARVMEAASGVFAEEGLSASMDDIARRAGLGKATIFRRFGDKNHLLAALACDRLTGMAELGEQLASDPDAGSALRRFMAAAVEQQVSDRALCQAIGGLSRLEPDVHEAKSRLIRAADALLREAQHQGAIRTDLTTLDVMLLVAAISQAVAPLHDYAPRLWRRYLDVVFDGLRPDAANPISQPPPTASQLKAAFGRCPWQGQP